MKHFGIISPPVQGHLHPMAALGRELVARGHRVSLLHMPDLEGKAEAEGLGFEAIGCADHPRGSLAASLQALGRQKGFAALRFTIAAVAKTSEMVCRDAPDVIRRAGIDALIVDQMEPAGGAVAEHLGLPFVTVANALALNRDPAVPPAFSPWRYSGTPWARWRNRIGYAIADRVTSPITRVVEAYRRRWHLPPLESPEASFSSLAQLSQLPRELDYPRSALPETFHYVGPLRRERPGAMPFPWERLDGRPLIYASLGTLQNSREPVFRCIAEACRTLDVQLVISHGGGLTGDQAAGLPGDPVVVSYAPQLEVLPRAALTITHAGLNTVLDSVAGATPVVAVPITYEQPAIARRVEWAGVGKSLPLGRLQPERLRALIRDVTSSESCRRSVRAASESIGRAGGVRRAADLILAAVA